MTVNLTKMPGDDKLDRLLDLCPTVRDRGDLIEIMVAAREDYLSGKLASARDLAGKYPMLPLAACHRLIDSFGWKNERAARLEDVQVAAAMEYAEMVRQRRAATVGAVLDSIGPTVQKLSGEIDAILGPAADKDSKYRTIDARRLAEALAQLSGVLLQAVAADGKMPELPESAQAKAGDGKRPWVNVTASGPVTIAQGETKSAPQGAEPKQETGEET